MRKKFRKMALTMAIMATLFNQCDVQAAESEKAVVQAEVRENQSAATAEDKNKDKKKKIDSKEIKARIDELD